MFLLEIYKIKFSRCFYCVNFSLDSIGKILLYIITCGLGLVVRLMENSHENLGSNPAPAKKKLTLLVEEIYIWMNDGTVGYNTPCPKRLFIDLTGSEEPPKKRPKNFEIDLTRYDDMQDFLDEKEMMKYLKDFPYVVSSDEETWDYSVQD